MNARTKMSSKGQVVIPKDIRDALRLTPGEILDIAREGRRIILQAVEPGREKISYEEFKRRVPPHVGPTISTEEMDAAVARMFEARGKDI